MINSAELLRVAVAGALFIYLTRFIRTFSFRLHSICAIYVVDFVLQMQFYGSIFRCRLGFAEVGAFRCHVDARYLFVDRLFYAFFSAA